MTESIPDGPSAPEPGDDDLIERIVAEYEPIVARTRRVLAAVWHDRSISKTSLFVLMQLESHGPVSMSRLAALLDANLPNVTGIVGRMEDLGLVERFRDDRDRRVVLVRSTPRGHELVEDLEAVRRDQLRRMLALLDPDERTVCLHAFRALRRAAGRLDGHEEPSPTARAVRATDDGVDH